MKPSSLATEQSNDREMILKAINEYDRDAYHAMQRASDQLRGDRDFVIQV
jgi:hypothetical protein